MACAHRLVGRRAAAAWGLAVAVGLGAWGVGSARAEAGPSAAPSDPEAAWDVAALEHTGPVKAVPIDVREGTWMSLDVSPSGELVVFDLLGDLYEVPIGGGPARALTSGPAWDMHPRYAPDGLSVVFVSDRGGGDNLWRLELPREAGAQSAEAAQPGEEPLARAAPEAITRESFRLVTSPAIAPDGRYVVGRKHYTGERSLGAGELWLYALGAGGSAPTGVRLVGKRTAQKDLGEPAFGPNGRWLYYSSDVTPGERFEYEKDPNGEIYAIDRLDRRSGRVERVVGGPGGAVRPTPSPDGRTLAFVRRARGRSVLTLLDLTSRAERPLWDGLDRDMQETWAIHGVYPSMAWTPDSKALVVWAGGGLHRVEVPPPGAAASVTPIPFHVVGARQVVEALRGPPEDGSRRAAPERFPVRALRGVAVSPDGETAVFEAMGRLWKRALPAGEPSLLTRARFGSGEPNEAMAAFTPDGRHVVYVTWDDQALGRVRLAALRTGNSRVVLDVPGVWLEPTVSPDGKTLVVRKAAGGWLMSSRHGTDTGLWALPLERRAASNGPRWLTREGRDPHFGADASRVFYSVRRRVDGGAHQVDLKSVPVGDAAVGEAAEPSDGHVRTHATFEAAVRVRVAPDGEHLAFQQAWQAHVARLPATGVPARFGPGSAALPTVEVSDACGDWLHWAPDGATLYWVTGQELHRVDVRAALAPPGDQERAEAEAGARPDEGRGAGRAPGGPGPEPIALGFDHPTARAEGTFALVGVRVLPMTGTPEAPVVLEDATLVWRGDRIVALGPRASTPVPRGAILVPTDGMVDPTVLPGLVDVHFHGAQGHLGLLPQQNWNALATLAFGVTTVHDPSHGTLEIFASSEAQRGGRLLAPRTFSTGSIIYGAEQPYWMARVDSQDDARRHIERLRAAGAFSVKSYNQPRRDQRQQVLAAARALDTLVVPEGGSVLAHNLTQIVDGHTGIEHALPAAALYDDVVQLWAATDVGYTPTLNVAYGGLMGETYWYGHTDVWKHPRLARFVPRFALDPRARRVRRAPPEEYNHVAAARAAWKLAQHGVTVHVGSHGQREGLGAHWELWSLVQGGFPPHEALRAATANGADYLGLDPELGRLEPGKLADLAVIGFNPLDDVRLSEHVAYTVLGGRVYDAATMQPLDGEARRRQPLFFEEDAGQGAGPTHVHTASRPHGCGCHRH